MYPDFAGKPLHLTSFWVGAFLATFVIVLVTTFVSWLPYSTVSDAYHTLGMPAFYISIGGLIALSACISSRRAKDKDEL